jgi:DNA integrity scanning protein DisA with diadenylate cyclase activity
MPSGSVLEGIMAQKGLELRPVMTRIPEKLRQRLEREAAHNRRSMNMEIVMRLQASFDAPDLTQQLSDAVAFAIEDQVNSIQSQIRAILAHLGLPDPVEEGAARRLRESESPEMKAALERALQELERAGYKIARPKEDKS